jgi:acetyl esterase
MLNPESEELLRRIADWPNLAERTVANARAGEDLRQRDLAGTGPEMFKVENLVLPGPECPLPVVAYHPTRETARGVMVWCHGGGWTVGSPASSDDEVRAIAEASGWTVLSVDYRLAPEYPFPKGLEDFYSALAWAGEHSDELGAEPHRLAVGGGSSGGNIAAATTLLARQRGGPVLDFQILFYPALARELDVAPSRDLFAEGYWMTWEDVDWFWEQYLPESGDAANPLASPLLSESLAGLPGALIVLAECDVLFSEGRHYAQRLGEYGVAVDLRVYEGMLHGFLVSGAVVNSAWGVLREVGETLRSVPGRES